jgi:hypothetical protein
MLKRIQVIDATDLSNEAEEYLESIDVWTHDVDNILYVGRGDDNAFAKCVKDLGFQFDSNEDVTETSILVVGS